MFKCKLCKTEDKSETIPYMWSKIHEEAAGVHDSACVTHEYDYFLCGGCRVRIAELEVEGGTH